MCLDSDHKTRDFHESYYEHSCAVVAERDVLDTDIHGTTFTARFQRWWHDLFLLSYSDGRSRVYYTSSYSMRKERQRHYRRFNGRIHPLSKFRKCWDFTMLLVFISNKLSFHHNSSFIFCNLSRLFYYIGAGLELVIIADLFVNMATGYIDQQTRNIVLDKRLGVLHYCSTKLFLHVASAIPLQWLMLLRYGLDFDCTLCKTTRFVCILEVVSLFDMFRLYECTEYFSREGRSFNISYFLKFLRIAILALFSMIQFIEIADILTVRIMVEQGYVHRFSYVARLLKNKYAVSVSPDPFFFFVFDFSRVCKSILLFSFAFRKNTYYVDRIVSLLAYMIANFFFLWTIAECYKMMCHTKFPEDRFIAIQNSTLNMARSFQLSDKLTAKLKRYYNFNFSNLKSVEKHNILFVTLPEVLKSEQFFASYGRFIMRFPYFAEWPTTIKTKLVHMLKEEMYLRHDLVAEPWIQSEGLSFVASGELAVYTDDIETGHLIDGDYYGELSLVTDRELTTSGIVAITPSLILILPKQLFRRYMRQYPDLFLKMKRQLKENYGRSNTSSQQSI